MTLTPGAFHYDPNVRSFHAAVSSRWPRTTTTLMQATVTHNISYAFARVFNLTSINVSATAIAAHRPRDMNIVLDYSGSMNNESDLWNCETYLGTMINTSNNTDPIFPAVGTVQSDLVAPGDHAVHELGPARRLLQREPGRPREHGPCPGLLPECTRVRPCSMPSPPHRLRSPTTSPGGRNGPEPGVRTYQTYKPTSPKAFVARRPETEHLGSKDIKIAYNQSQFYGYRQGSRLLGQDVLHLAPRPDGRLATVNPNSNTGNSCDWRKRFFLKAGGSYPNFGGPGE